MSLNKNHIIFITKNAEAEQSGRCFVKESERDKEWATDMRTEDS